MAALSSFRWFALPTIQLPHKWRPRAYQRAAWDYLERGGRHAELIWHRRSGKDEISLHRTACAAFERKATYWHMLPEASQARKAIWEAINPHTGVRRIDEAFPLEIRASTNATEMLIRFKNGSTWQVVGSDNFNSLVGSPPAGVVFSEWALANPASRAYLRPILLENGGWQIYITTPRGKNHAHRTYTAAKKEPGAFAQVLAATETKTLSAEQLESERLAYIEDFGLDQGEALFEQEYMCSFDAAVMGAYYAKYLANAEREGRIGNVPYQDEFPVYTAWDIGYSDDTAIWFYQVIRGEVRVIDYYAANGHGVDHYAEVLDKKAYHYARMGSKPVLYLPHDARAKTFAAQGKSAQEQFFALGYTSHIVPQLSLQDGIQAVRAMLPRCVFDAERCGDAVESLKLYRREWDEDRRVFRDTPLHDWTSHPADAFRMLAVMWKEQHAPLAPPPPKFDTDRTIQELINRQRDRRLSEEHA